METEKKPKPESLFMQSLTRTGSEVKKARAKGICGKVKDCQVDLVNGLRKKQREIVNELLDLQDLGPNSTMSLVPVDKDFDSENWCEKLQELSVDLKDLNDQLEIAINNYNKFFAISDKEKLSLEDE